MNPMLPEDSVVGSWDAGVIGYFSRYQVVNLDGLANSYGYLRAKGKEPRPRSTGDTGLPISPTPGPL